jgi:hypothetical protein
MNCDVTLKAEEFKAIHNTLWAMEYQGMDSKTAAEKIREALSGAYAQESKAFNRKSDHYSSVKEDLGLRTIWSIYEVDNLSERHPFEGIATVTYKDHWGKKPVVKPVNGFTYAALYVAADAAIRDSGDEHHVFIEQFKQVGDTLLLTTGS